MDTLRQDLVYALRSLRRQPGFTLITVLTLALGIGANTAVFSVVNGVVLRPLGYEHPERLQFVTSQFPNIGFQQFWVDLPEFVEFRDRNHSFESVGAYNVGAINLDTNPPSRPVRAVITPELMPVLGVQPVAGRWFTKEDSAPKAPAVAILSFELWQRAYGGDRGVLNKVVQINSVGTQIVGIMPRGFDVHDQKVELWEPLTIDPATLSNQRGSHFLYMVGRLKPGVTLGQARADLEVLLKEWPGTVPNKHTPDPVRHRLQIDPLKEDVVGSVRTALIVLQAAVGFVLLIACANLANLLIARADSRMREYAVRSALGASRHRLLRQLITEGLVLATAGAAAGTGLAWGGLRLLLAANPNAIPRTAEIGLDTPVLGFTLLVAVVTGLVFGLVPLAHIGRDRASQAMRESSARTTAGTARARMRSVLVVAEVALAVVLVVGAGLLIRSFMNLTRQDMGFDRSQLSTFGIVLPNPPYDAARRLDFYQRVTTRLQTVPGVQSVAAMTGLPPLRSVNANDTDFEAIPNMRPPGSLPVENVDFWQYVTAGYTATMGIPVVRGRAFEPGDAGGAPVVLVNEALVHRFFPDRDPIGQHLKPGFGDTTPWFTVVGVLKDVKQAGVDASVGTELYMLTEQMPRVLGFAPGNMNFVMRSTRSFDLLAPEFRRSVGEIDATLPLIRPRSMTSVVDDAIARPRFLTLLLGLFAGLALALAAVGTYGVLSYLVSERRQEIGIRMALGADRGEILRLVLFRGLMLSGIGLVGGLAAAAGLTRVIKTMLFNVTPTDPLTLGVVAGVIAIVAAAACVVPAWRATRTDPMVVLRGA
jgi:putative ABC transport system permease protein